MNGLHFILVICLNMKNGGATKLKIWGSKSSVSTILVMFLGEKNILLESNFFFITV